MLPVVFTIPGKPFAKQRPRFSRRNGRAFTPSETVSFERQVGMIAAQHFPKHMAGPIRLRVFATFKPAKSWSKKKTAEHMNRPHMQKPDLDNVVKAISDGLNRIAYADDAQIVAVEAEKYWGPDEKTVVMIEPVEWSDKEAFADKEAFDAA